MPYIKIDDGDKDVPYTKPSSTEILYRDLNPKLNQSITRNAEKLCRWRGIARHQQK